MTDDLYDDVTCTMSVSGGPEVDITNAMKSQRRKTPVPGLTTDEERADMMGDSTRQKLRSFVSRIERLEAEKAELTTDIRELYSEIKSFGFDTKVMRKLISLRKQDVNERAEQEALLDLYQGALDD